MLIPSIPEMNWAEISGQGLGHNWTDVCLTPVYIIITLFTSHRILGWDPSILTMSPMSPSSHSFCSWYLLWSDVSWPADLGRLAPARHWPSLPGLSCGEMFAKPTGTQLSSVHSQFTHPRFSSCLAPRPRHSSSQTQPTFLLSWGVLRREFSALCCQQNALQFTQLTYR